MMPADPLSSWARLEVVLLISDAFDKYDAGQELRHTENSKKLDRLLWAIIGTLFTVVGGIIVDMASHLMK